jgi:uncharacterized membrane protein (DUF106 family)
MVLEILSLYPKTSLIIIALLITLVSTLVTKWLTNQEHLNGLKKRQKEIQNELKNCKGDECKMKELNMEMLQITGTMMKSSFKPLLITFIPFLILLYWLRTFYTPLIGGSWFWYYLVTGLVSSMAFRKIFKMA